MQENKLDEKLQNSTEETKDDKIANRAESVRLGSLESTEVAVSQVIMHNTNKENIGDEDLKEEDDILSEDEIDSKHDMSSPVPPMDTGFLSSNAITNVLKSVQYLESSLDQDVGENGKPAGKPDIHGIKEQVKMIQQQQAYQIQMLNYLHWQLAVLSSNPQAAMQQVASSMRSALPIGMPSGMPPQMPPSGPGGLMPSMMAAMAMNGSNNPNMDIAAKARMMMNSQGGSQHFRSMFGHHGRTLSREENEGNSDEGSATSFDPKKEQRYQLQEPNMEQINQSESLSMSPTKPEEKNIMSSPLPSNMDRKSHEITSQQTADMRFPIRSMSEENMPIEDRDHNSTSPYTNDGDNSAYRHRCKFCQKVFGSDSALQIHLRSHTGERPYKCNICGNRFTTKGNLKVHFMRHKAKYPHIPMNPHPVPEYLDGVPTTTGLPYGMSILPEKAVFERPRLHGNPSIHLNSRNSATITQPPTHPSGIPNSLFPYSNLSPEQASHHIRPGYSLNGPAEIALMQSQLLERQHHLDMVEKHRNEMEVQRSPNPDKTSSPKDSKPSASMLQAAMMPFFRFAKRDEALKSLHSGSRRPADGGNSDGRSSYSSSGSSSPPHSHGRNPNHPSETSKLERLVENIDRGRALQKNECHICNRVLSCQSALKLHYRTHTGNSHNK